MSRSRGLNGVTGGTLPAAIWRKFMVAATAGEDTGTFTEPTSFPGRVLHDELEQTTTTEATSSTSSTTSSTTSTTVEETTTTTTAPGFNAGTSCASALAGSVCGHEPSFGRQYRS